MTIKLGFLTATLFSAALLASCSSEDQAVEVKEPEPTEEVVTNEAVTEEPQEEEAELGTRTNPVPFKETAVIPGETSYNDELIPITFEMTILETIRGEEAFTRLKEMNEFNEPADEGYEWLLINAKTKFSESESENASFFIDGVMFDAVSESGDIYSGDNYGTTEPDFSFEMYPGNEKEGYMAKQVKVGEEVKLRYSDFSGETFLNLQ